MDTIEVMNGTVKCLTELEETKKFLDNAFFFLAHRDRILKDSRMFLAPVPIHNTILYHGGVCLGVYLKWWLSCDSALGMTDDNRMSLVYLLAGSLCTGSNRCREVDESGTYRTVHLSDFMSSVGNDK